MIEFVVPWLAKARIPVALSLLFSLLLSLQATPLSAWGYSVGYQAAGTFVAIGISFAGQYYPVAPRSHRKQALVLIIGLGLFLGCFTVYHWLASFSVGSSWAAVYDVSGRSLYFALYALGGYSAGRIYVLLPEFTRKPPPPEKVKGKPKAGEPSTAADES